MDDCIFCKIANKEINTEIIYENESVIAFKDLNPKAKLHFLIIPKKHYETILDIEDDETKIGLFKAIKEIASKFGIDEKGFRIISNCKEDGGQEVMHMHIHLLGGEKLNTNII